MRKRRSEEEAADARDFDDALSMATNGGSTTSGNYPDMAIVVANIHSSPAAQRV